MDGWRPEAARFSTYIFIYLGCHPSAARELCVQGWFLGGSCLLGQPKKNEAP